MDEELDWLEKQILQLSKLEIQNRELISLVLWSARRLHKSHKTYAYKDLLGIIGENHELTNYIKDLQNK